MMNDIIKIINYVRSNGEYIGSFKTNKNVLDKKYYFSYTTRQLFQKNNEIISVFRHGYVYDFMGLLFGLELEDTELTTIANYELSGRGWSISVIIEGLNRGYYSDQKIIGEPVIKGYRNQMDSDITLALTFMDF